jgi:glycosyltransferase involved in cell wall biosynthesis
MDAALNRIGDYHAKTQRITWGLDLDRFRPDRDTRQLRERWSIPTADLVFFDPRLGRAFYNKHIILEAFAGYLQDGRASATLVVAEALGDPAYLSRLRKLADHLGIREKVRFVGEIAYESMPDYCALADVTISIPPSDGLPQTIYEAFACGSFLIVGNLPQYSGVVNDGVTARVVRPGDVQQLKDALAWSVAKPAVRQRAREAGRAYVEGHADLRVQAARMNEIYARLLPPAGQGTDA